ncbi:hypothetical protein HPB48_026094 [Haemaphysalis longicornis]|uniref:Uncharacterized protein n=1 Tax=Haemaphysalis longicornis TaxID=44386 RepID=A0A9J6H9W9_HAELO|nr:hypothetical protein HPB48_026094 [Haemaphysalis longicornis]
MVAKHIAVRIFASFSQRVWMERRPFFIIGHMVNSLYDVDVFVNSGANALEADIQFDATGTPTWVYHGIPCDCNREGRRYAEIPEYLDYLRNVTDVGKHPSQALSTQV